MMPRSCAQPADSYRCCRRNPLVCFTCTSSDSACLVCCDSCGFTRVATRLQPAGIKAAEPEAATVEGGAARRHLIGGLLGLHRLRAQQCSRQAGRRRVHRIARHGAGKPLERNRRRSCLGDSAQTSNNKAAATPVEIVSSGFSFANESVRCSLRSKATIDVLRAPCLVWSCDAGQAFNGWHWMWYPVPTQPLHM
jgi:hypothetical protein